MNAGYELAQVNANAAEAELEKQRNLLFPENPEVAKGIQKFQKEAAAELVAGTGAGASNGGRRSRRHRKMKMRTQKRRSN